MKRLLPVVVMTLLLAGCATWVKTEGRLTSAGQQFTVDPPQGWMRRNSDSLFVITRDGFPLQTILISRMKISEEKQFRHTTKRVTAGMLPNEIAEVIIDDFQSDPDRPVDAVEENVPADVGGKKGSLVRLAYTTKTGLKFRCQIYACLCGGWLYRVSYLAPARYYFDKDLPTVQNMMKTFVINAT
ncbi:MAG TPA: hypothetical protein VJ550_07140 [Geomonas sp.]|nr:hypothetical protein [Geomonas sp.]